MTSYCEKVNIVESSFERLLQEEHLWSQIQHFETTLSQSRISWREGREAYLGHIKQALHENNGFILCVEREGVAVGLCVAWEGADDDCMQKPEWRRFGYVQDIIVHENARRQGIARALLEHAEGIFKKRGFKFMRIGALAANEAAVQSYLRAGFEPFECNFTKEIAA